MKTWGSVQSRNKDTVVSPKTVTAMMRIRKPPLPGNNSSEPQGLTGTVKQRPGQRQTFTCWLFLKVISGFYLSRQKAQETLSLKSLMGGGGGSQEPPSFSRTLMQGAQKQAFSHGTTTFITCFQLPNIFRMLSPPRACCPVLYGIKNQTAGYQDEIFQTFSKQLSGISGQEIDIFLSSCLEFQDKQQQTGLLMPSTAWFLVPDGKVSSVLLLHLGLHLSYCLFMIFLGCP